MSTNSIGTIAAHTQFTLIGDTNHTGSAQMYGDLAGKMPATALAGVKHLIVEFPKEVQPLLSELAEGKLTAEQFFAKKDALYEKLGAHYPKWEGTDTPEEKAYRENLTAMVREAHKQGMKVECVDEIPAALLEKSYKHPEDAQIYADLLGLRADRSKSV